MQSDYYAIELFKIRDEHAYTKKDMARRLQIPVEMYARYERGDSEPKFEVLLRIEAEFKVKLKCSPLNKPKNKMEQILNRISELELRVEKQESVIRKLQALLK